MNPAFSKTRIEATFGEHFESVRHERSQGVWRDAAVPEPASEPIADHGAGAVHVRTGLHADSPGKIAVGHDGEVLRWFYRAVTIDLQARVFAFVRRRKLQSYVARYARIIRDAREFADIARVPRAQGASLPLERHGGGIDRRLQLCAMALLRKFVQPH